MGKTFSNLILHPASRIHRREIPRRITMPSKIRLDTPNQRCLAKNWKFLLISIIYSMRATVIDYFRAILDGDDMKDEKLYVKRDINEEKVENVPEAAKGGLKDLEKEARTDAKVIDKESRKMKLEKM